MLRLLSTRAAPVVATGAVGAWAAVTTQNDDWDEYFPPQPASTDRERIVILGSGWGGLNALMMDLLITLFLHRLHLPV